jgi:hypothetical protein
MSEPRDVAAMTGGTAARWPDARARLAAAGRYFLSSTGPDRRPHTMPVLAVWAGDALHFCTGPSSRKGLNLARDPRIVVCTGDEAADLVVEGAAERVTDAAELGAVAGVYREKYDWAVEVRDAAFWADGAPTAGEPPFHVFAVRPAQVFLFPASEGLTPTRWRF